MAESAEALVITKHGRPVAGLDPAEFHGDSIDRLIYATAVEHDIDPITADGRLCEADPAGTVW